LSSAKNKTVDQGGFDALTDLTKPRGRAMAKADDKSSTTAWIWLREALELAVTALGSVALAKERLIEWLTADKLRWCCMEWKGHTAEEIAKAEQQLRGGYIMHILPSAAYHEGDPKLWRSPHLQIDWEDNVALELATGGAKARGIKVSRAQLLTLLPALPPGTLAAADEPAPPLGQRRQAGAKPQYDWDAIQARCCQWFNDDGFPDNVSAFCRDKVIPWCQEQYGEEGTPDMETLRPRVAKWVEAWQRSLLPK
jgi:hypothetical protein